MSPVTRSATKIPPSLLTHAATGSIPVFAASRTSDNTPCRSTAARPVSGSEMSAPNPPSESMLTGLVRRTSWIVSGNSTGTRSGGCIMRRLGGRRSVSRNISPEAETALDITGTGRSNAVVETCRRPVWASVGCKPLQRIRSSGASRSCVQRGAGMARYPSGWSI